jgi:hypothetical protein
VPGAKSRTGAVSLSLVPLEVMDTRVAFGALCRPFEIAHSEVLASLGVRIGLLLGRGLLRPGQNPFRPEVFLGAIHDAWRAFTPDAQDHPVLLPLLRPEHFLDLGPLLETLDAALRARSKGAPERFHISKTTGGPRRTGMDPALAQQLRSLLGADEEGATALVPDLPDMPQGNGWRPSSAAGFGVAPGAGVPGTPSPASGQPGSLLALLAGLQPPTGGAATPSAAPHKVFYLPRLKQSLPQGALSRGEENTLDLLSRIFETVLLDDSIPAETRELIRFLQVPVLKAALLDQTFFFEEAHPARRMIDLLSNMGWEGRKGVDDPVVQAMQRGVERIGREGGAQPAAFADALAEVEAELDGVVGRVLTEAMEEAVNDPAPVRAAG